MQLFTGSKLRASDLQILTDQYGDRHEQAPGVFDRMNVPELEGPNVIVTPPLVINDYPSGQAAQSRYNFDFAKGARHQGEFHVELDKTLPGDPCGARAGRVGPADSGMIVALIGKRGPEGS